VPEQQTGRQAGGGATGGAPPRPGAIEVTSGRRLGRLPRDVLLASSASYPGAGHDGRPVQRLHHRAASLVYADSFFARAELLREIENVRTGFLGYELLARRAVERDELVPPDRKPPELEDDGSSGWPRTVPAVEPFAEWLVFRA
jgi:hypothetical protein